MAGQDIRSLPRVSAIATMPSRLETFRAVVANIRGQVNHLFVYLDGFDEVPAFLRGLGGVSIYRAENVGNMHASSRFLCVRELTSPTVVAIVDDDIAYPADYVERLTGALHRFGGNALVGVHGRVFRPPHRSYVRDGFAVNFKDPLPRHRNVHEVGVGTCAFLSNRLPVDPRNWDRYNMNDIYLAIEAQKRGLPRIVIARPAGWMRSLSQGQADSLWSRTKKDDSEHSRRMRKLLGLYAGAAPLGTTRQSIS
jgi:hypothetical protein